MSHPYSVQSISCRDIPLKTTNVKPGGRYCWRKDSPSGEHERLSQIVQQSIYSISSAETTIILFMVVLGIKCSGRGKKVKKIHPLRSVYI